VDIVREIVKIRREVLTLQM